ncbi:MAG: ATP-binding protein [Kouleothrix sp.]|nr:ATP-binding protein [Kouleothrix sp.]
MPDPHRLAILTELRREASVTLEQMALACGLVGRKGRESASAWERGQSAPHIRSRTRFIDYLGNLLGLRNDPARFLAVWERLAEQWGWDSVGEAEWLQHFGNLASAELPGAGLAANRAPLDEWASPHQPRGPNGLLPAPAPLPPGSRVPLNRNPFFVGRAAELHALASTVLPRREAGAPASALAITGISGSGKTDLVCEFVHRYGQFYPGGVFWLSCATPGGVPGEIASCGRFTYIALLRLDFDRLSLDEQARLVVEAWQASTARLLIFDGCEDPALLARWAPRSGGCHLLVTSRRPEWSMASGMRQMPLSMLQRHESVALLRNHCPDLPANDVALIGIAAQLGDLPLALQLAGSFLARHRVEITPAEYLRQLRSPGPPQRAKERSG